MSDMKANELRIGNLLLIDGLHGECIMTVESITAKGQMREENRVIYFLEDNCQVGEFMKHCSGIPLTEDWLLKFGFIKYDEYFFKIKLKKGYSEGWYLGSDNTLVKSISEFMVRYKHVHQLQNLYFALTQTELIIK